MNNKIKLIQKMKDIMEQLQIDLKELHILTNLRGIPNYSNILF